MNTPEHVYDCAADVPWMGLCAGDVLRVRIGIILWTRVACAGDAPPRLLFEGVVGTPTPDGKRRYELGLSPLLLFALAREPGVLQPRGDSLPALALWNRREGLGIGDAYSRKPTDPPKLTLIR